MPKLERRKMNRCEVVEMRNSAEVGDLCSRTASTQCSDWLWLSLLPVLLFIPSSTDSKPAHGERRERKRAKTRTNCGFRCSGLFPVREGHKLVQNFLQSLEPPFLVGGRSSISPVYIRAVRFTNLGYFFPKFLDTL